MAQNKPEFKLTSNGLFGLLILAIGFVALWFIAKSVFTLLSWVAPFLLVGALIVNYKTVIGYGKFVLSLLKRNWIMGLVAIVLTIFGFPIVTGFLFAKSFLDRKVNKMMDEQKRQVEGELVEYEDVTDEVTEVTEEAETLELPPIKKAQPEKIVEKNEYDDLFNSPGS